MRELSAAAQTWIAVVLLGGAIAAAVALLQMEAGQTAVAAADPTLWLLLVGACVAHGFPVVAPRHQAYHATQSVLMAAVLVLSWPAVALIVIAAHIVESLRRPRPLYIQLYNVATYLIAAGAALGFLEATGARPLSFENPRTLGLLVCAAALMLVLNHGLTAVVLRLARGVRLADSGLFGRESLSVDGALMLVGIGMGVGLQIQPLSIVVTGAPLILMYRALRLSNVESASHRDQLTGLYNARHLLEALEVELHRAHARGHSTALLLAVIDDVPAIVQHYGRATLDFLVLAIGRRLGQVMCEYDVVARLDDGGLGLLLPMREAADLRVLGSSLDELVASEPFGLPTTREPVAVSASLAFMAIPAAVRLDAAQVLAELRQGGARAALSGPRAVLDVEPPAPVALRPGEPMPATRARAVALTSAWSPPRRWLLAFETTLVALGLLLSALVLARFHLPDLPLVMGTLGLVVLSELLAFELYDRSSFSVSFAPIVAAGLLGGPAATLVATWSVALVRGGLRRSAWHRIAFNASVFTLTGVPAMMVAAQAGTLEIGASQLGRVAISTALASTLYYAHTFLVAFAISLDLGADPREVWVRNFRWLYPHYLILGWMGLGLAVATVALGPLGTALFVAPPLAMRVVLKQYVDRTAGAVHRLEVANAELRSASSLLRERGEELALLSDLGQLVVAEPRSESLPGVVVARCVPALGEVCGAVWQSSHGIERSVASAAAAAATGTRERIEARALSDVLALAEGIDRGQLPEWIAAAGGTWLATPLAGVDQNLGWLVAWSADVLSAEESARRMDLMREVARRLALVLERDALLEEAAELDALRVVDRAKSDFIATTAHELRTPLTSLQGYTELLRQPVDPDLRDRWLGIVQVEAAQLGQVVDQLLDVSRLESGRFQPDRRDFDLIDIVKPVVDHFSAQASLTGHALEVDCSEALRVHADPTHVERVLRNLVSNALKYSPGGGQIRIAVVAVEPGDVEVCVADRGLGIPREWLGRLFERFQRVEASDRASIRGTGLGLYIARQLVELNGGRIWADSGGVGQGSTFRFTLPRVHRTRPIR